MRLYNYLILFSLFFIPFIIPAGITFHLPYYFLIALAYLYIYRCIRFGIRINDLTLLIIQFFYSSYFLFNSLLHSTVDTQFLFEVVLSILFCLACLEVSKQVGSKYSSYEELILALIKAIYGIGVIHALIMIAVFLSEGLQDWLYSIVYINEVGKEFLELAYRSPGLTTAGGDGLSVFQSVALVLGLYVFLNNRDRVGLFKTLFYFISFLILIVSIFLSGRTGLVVFALGCVLIILNRPLLSARINTVFVFRVCISVFCLMFLVFFLYFLLQDSPYVRLFNRVFELFLNYLNKGEITTSSTTDLANMFFLPTSELQLIIGDGNFGRSENLDFLHTDVGYVRILFGGGIIGFLCLFIPVISISVIYFFTIKSRSYKFLLIFCLLMFVVVNLKVLFVFPSALGIKLFYLVLSFAPFYKEYEREKVI